jgi:hypothetical protein
MFSFNDLMNSATNIQAMGDMAKTFGISPQQTQAAVQSLMPAFASSLQQQASNPQNIGTLLASMMPAAMATAAPAPPPAPEAPPAFSDPFAYGNAVMAQLFGAPQNTSQIAQVAAQSAGLQPQLVQQMMPLVAGMVMNGLALAMQGQVKQMQSQFSSPQTTPQPTGFAAFFPNLMLSMPKPDPATQAAQSGFDALTKIMQGGVQLQQAQLEGLQAILSQLSQKR